MPYAVELYFDASTERTIRQIWQAIAEAGFKSLMLEAGYRPHISLGVYDGETFDVAGLREDLTAYAETILAFNLELSHLGLFPTAEGVIFLGVSVRLSLLDLHANFHRTFENYAEALRPYYEIENWVPHSTLAFGLSAEESANIVPICWRTRLPIRGQAQEIGLAKVSPLQCEFLFSSRLRTAI